MSSFDQSESNSEQGKTIPIVGIGASAGGLEALEEFFSQVSQDSGMAYIVLVHSSPDQVSLLPEILQRCTAATVTLATDGDSLHPNHVYVIPPQTSAYITETQIKIDLIERRKVLSSIDFFLRSLADNHGHRAVGVILSGMGSDGTLGIKAIKSQEGLVIVQSEESALYKQMPHSAILSGVADAMLSPEWMPETINYYFQQSAVLTETTSQEWLNQIFNVLRSRLGHDFSNYKQNTLVRRIKRRMSLQQINDYRQYLNLLNEDSQEVNALFREFLIGVTSFFRDHDAFDYLQTKVLPSLLESFPNQGTFRVWVPGCSTGEEVYSLAMILREALDNCSKYINLQIFGTDIDQVAIDYARNGVYPASVAADIGQHRLQRFFEPEDQFYRVGKEIRYSVVFSVQNILKDPPFSHLNLLSCRNLLIYLNEEAQKKLLPLFHYTLVPSGIMMLGSSETIGNFQNLFLPLSNKSKIFQRREAENLLNQPLEFPTGLFQNLPNSPQISQASRQKEQGNLGKLVRQTILEKLSPTAILIESNGLILHVEGRTNKFLEITGSPTNNLIDMAQEGLRVELASALRTAIASEEIVTRQYIPIDNNGGTQWVKFSINPLKQPQRLAGRLLVLLEVMESEKIRENKNEEKWTETASLQEANNRIAELERELQETHESHQRTIKELESSNEELQATNEELESSNEELQATNEELESSKEELQSLNEELQTVNEELQNKVDELSAAENDMQNFLNITELATIFVDNQMNIKRFTPPVTELVNLIASDIGRPLQHISTNLKQDSIIHGLEQVLTSLTPQITRVKTTEGKWYRMQILPYRTNNNRIEGAILTFTDINELKQAEDTLQQLKAELEQTKLALQDVIEANSEPLILLNANKQMIAVSQGVRELITFLPRRDWTEWEQILSQQLESELRTKQDFSDVPFVIDSSYQNQLLVDAKVIGKDANMIHYFLLKLKRA